MTFSAPGLLVALATGLAGFLAQLVDGGLGMGFGVTSTTVMITLAGLAPATASAVVHVAELGTTAASGISHWRFGNVDLRSALWLGIPGGIGAFIGALFLTSITSPVVTSVILTALGVNVMWRFSRRRQRPVRSGSESRLFLTVLGFFGGLVDATGGGGWGPVTSSTMLSLRKQDPRRIVGTVNTAEFLVTLSATAGFVVGLWDDILKYWPFILALLAGGSIAAPLAAWIVSRFNPSFLGVLVGTLLVVLNLPRILPGITAWPLQVALIAFGVFLGWRCWKFEAAERRHREADKHTQAPESLVATVGS